MANAMWKILFILKNIKFFLKISSNSRKSFSNISFKFCETDEIKKLYENFEMIMRKEWWDELFRKFPGILW